MNRPTSTMVHATLMAYAVLALLPIVLILINSVKSREAIFARSAGAADDGLADLDRLPEGAGQHQLPALLRQQPHRHLAALCCIVLFGAMAAWALSEYRFMGNRVLTLFLALGIMIPIRLGTVSILELMVRLDLVNTLTALVLVYTAQGLPLAVLILSEFMRQVPTS
jgi:raffinose/stachyose/melibiose transport system permease protein